jgi:hypothetical protein
MGSSLRVDEKPVLEGVLEERIPAAFGKNKSV